METFDARLTYGIHVSRSRPNGRRVRRPHRSPRSRSSPTPAFAPASSTSRPFTPRPPSWSTNTSRCCWPTSPPCSKTSRRRTPLSARRLRVRTVNLTPDERANGHAHCRALLLTPSVCLNVVDGQLQLGRWQRVFFVDLDGPRSRESRCSILGEGPPMKVKMILPALTEATSPFWRPIKYSLFPPLGLATLAGYLGRRRRRRDSGRARRAAATSTTRPTWSSSRSTSPRPTAPIALPTTTARRGAHVALGGLHVTSLPEEAAAHADTIFLGPGEDTWPQFLADFARLPGPRLSIARSGRSPACRRSGAI